MVLSVFWREIAILVPYLTLTICGNSITLDAGCQALVEIRERLLPLVIPEPLAVAVRDVEECGLAGGGGVGEWIGLEHRDG